MSQSTGASILCLSALFALHSQFSTIFTRFPMQWVIMHCLLATSRTPKPPTLTAATTANPARNSMLDSMIVHISIDLLIKDFRSEISEFRDKIVEQILRPT